MGWCTEIVCYNAVALSILKFGARDKTTLFEEPRYQAFASSIFCLFRYFFLFLRPLVKGGIVLKAVKK
ncbi:hypothetical protein [Porphyromonas gulae]|uniref:Uncharacterized protein n=1 Tax=Porphyromonas gulae TaxID=111105 RepID=A0A0A2FIE2_9PORP|nr:hypothetical protein [Porphyromonas gulae]KGN89815.1 hypothetical protein HR15_03955 [Porphyromonas gulae]